MIMCDDKRRIVQIQFSSSTQFGNDEISWREKAYA